MALKTHIKRRKNIAFVILLILSIIWVLPLLWALGTSFKSNIDMTTNIITIIPRDFTFDNYKALFSNNASYPIFKWLRNSAIVSITHTLLYLLFATMAAYAFGVMRWKGRNLVFGLLLATMTIPSVINLTPLFTMVIQFGWLDSEAAWKSLFALILPGLGGVFGLFILRQFFANIPYDLIESAQIEGLGHFGVYRKIVLPLGKSAIMVAGLFAFMGSWNDYLWPTLTAAVHFDQNWYTLQTGLATMQSSSNYDPGLVIAAAIVSILPVLVVYMFVQDKIIEGVSHTGIK
ncbi:MAG: carbohydrate ABC transporter permease [Bacilli bacterium]